jgi:hypothetical protein
MVYKVFHMSYLYQGRSWSTRAFICPTCTKDSHGQLGSFTCPIRIKDSHGL